jgi:cation transport regulator ChaC
MQPPSSKLSFWHFAYGSNMSTRRNPKWQSSVLETAVAFLPGYRLAFNKLGNDGTMKASLVRAPDESAWGVCFLLPATARAVLDRQEGVAGGHYRPEHMVVETLAGDRMPAVVYVAGDRYVRREGKPSQEYLRYILDGAREHGLPSEYIDKIQWLGQGEPAC